MSAFKISLPKCLHGLKNYKINFSNDQKLIQKKIHKFSNFVFFFQNI